MARPWLLAIALLVYLPLAPADAAPSPLDAMFDNTVRITTTKGEEYVYFDRDGTFNATGPDGDTYGTWTIAAGKICTKTKTTPESCGVVEANRSVGDQWQHVINGETITIEIVKGR